MNLKNENEKLKEMQMCGNNNVIQVTETISEIMLYTNKKEEKR